MVSTYSPHRDGGGLSLHSASHLRHLESQSAIREIRRSLSRSPSKGTDLRHHMLRSQSPSAGSATFSPSPLSPSRRSISDHILHISAPISSPHAVPFPPSARIHRPTLRRSNNTPAVPRLRTSPKSPVKRVLTDSSDGGNASPMPLRKRASTEADRESSMEDVHVFGEKENESRLGDDVAQKGTSTRMEKRRSGGFVSPVAPLSPMKRSHDRGTLGRPAFGSPSKRRSLHGPTLDLSIFDTDLSADGDLGRGRRAQDDIDWQRCSSPMASSRVSTIPKRSSSLRKSTLQQRQNERPTLAKTHQNEDEAPSATTPVPDNPKKGLRMSLDNHLPPMARDSPFSSQGSLLSASIHPVAPSQAGSQGSQTQHHRHPLSRTMTQSSSASSTMDDSPTHEPVHRPDRPRSNHDFSKSLPIGATRPRAAFGSDDYSGDSSQGSFATPANYKSAKPLPAAFMSTGLISKKNRNNDEPHGGLPKAHMPDTPCKKQFNVFPAVPQFPPKVIGPVHSSRHSFGTPSTPFNSHHNAIKPAPFPFAKGSTILGNNPNRHTLARKASFASIEGEERAQPSSPLAIGDSQSTNESELPPTPSRRITKEEVGQFRTSPSRQFKTSLLSSNLASRSAQATRFTSSKLSPTGASPGSVDEDSDGVMEDSPSTSLRLKSSLNGLSVLPSLIPGHLLRNLNSPSPISRRALAVPLFHSKSGRTKSGCLSLVSPHQDRAARSSPHTPQENNFPLDPSGLSISVHNDRGHRRPASSSSSAVPATPTGPREYFPNLSNRPSLNLTAADGADVDQSLVSRFERVELVGTGEFSQVYRVALPPETSPFHKMYSISSARSSSRSSLPERVWAVKKSRHPYAGAKDRQRKIHEVDVLKALGHSDHILSFVDSWEEKNHLYIQTEFCEEGALDVFLAQVGLKARLDDFRIWKILLELSLGLRHIHDSGFIHLDLKPANVLITFEGVLKIADFGMATRWPARAGIEGEGDREYIGPEILMGRYDKPADIFALGLIMLETAGNVELPDNGASWQKLRNGDMSDVPSLTWSSEASNIFRDASGNPLPDEGSIEDFDGLEEHESQATEATASDAQEESVVHRKSIHMARSGELVHPPVFMIDATNDQALDNIVRWMISPDPGDRPVAAQLLHTVGVQWAESRRRAGATVFEGNWGPADEVLAEDAEMIDV
jgi:mitosis inhibitor protein kinase SWE1